MPEKYNYTSLQDLLAHLSRMAVCGNSTPSNGEALLNMGGTYIQVVDDLKKRIGERPVCIEDPQVSAFRDDVGRVAENRDYREALSKLVIEWMLLAVRDKCGDCLNESCKHNPALKKAGARDCEIVHCLNRRFSGLIRCIRVDLRIIK